MTLRSILNKLFFRKYRPGKVVASNGDKVLIKLTSEEAVSPPPPDVPIEPIRLTGNTCSLASLNLEPGVTYIITSTTKAPKYRLAESEHSNELEYTDK
jgi:hypothetical protein